MRYTHKLMSEARGGHALEEGELAEARDQRDAQDLATKVYDTVSG
ncbi:hypothetical protein [uncultured Methylobacterium sp.]